MTRGHYTQRRQYSPQLPECPQCRIRHALARSCPVPPPPAPKLPVPEVEPPSILEQDVLSASIVQMANSIALLAKAVDELTITVKTVVD